MDPVDRLLDIAAVDGHIEHKQIPKLRSFVAKKGGGVDMAGDLLMRFHHVPAPVVRALKDEVARHAPPVEEYSDFELVEDEPVEELPQVAPQPQAKPKASGRLIQPKGKRIQPKKKAEPKPQPPPEELEPTDPDAPAVLLTFPLDRDATKEQLQAYSEAFEVILYEARLRLADSLPRVTTTGPADTLLPLVDSLRAVGIPSMCVEHEGLFPHLRSLVVKGIERRGRDLEMTVLELYQRDKARLYEEPVVLDLDRPRLLIVGRYDFSSSSTVRVSNPEGHGSMLVTGKSNDFLPFAHLYYEDSETPFEFSENDLVNFEFLGREKGYSAKVNLQKLYTMLGTGEGVERDDRLHKFAGRIQEAFAGMGTANWSGGGTSFSASSTEMNNVMQTEALSRALYFRWLERRG